MNFLDYAQYYITAIDATSGLLAVLFVAVVLMVLGAVGLFLARDPIQQRIAHGVTGDHRPVSPSAVFDDGRHRGRRFKSLEKYWTPQDEQERSKVREQLYRAGYRRPSAVRTYFAVRVVLGLMVPIAIGIALPLITRNVDITTVILLTSVMIAVGFYAPAAWVVRRTQRRQAAVRDGFPDTLDMLLVCVEAGLGLDAALDRVAHEIEPAHPVIAEELTLCGWELRAGKARLDVLRDLAKRVGVPDVRAFVAVLTQSDRYGTSMAEAIRVYSGEMRNKRQMRAEEKANKLPVKLALGAILFTLPPVFLVLISPALVSVFRFLGQLTQ